MTALETERSEIQAKLASSDLYESGRSEQIATLVRRQGQLTQEIEALEEAWLETHAALEAAEAD
jgi:ATP-binding cassette subfamily F protein 3